MDFFGPCPLDDCRLLPLFWNVLFPWYHTTMFFSSTLVTLSKSSSQVKGWPLTVVFSIAWVSVTAATKMTYKCTPLIQTTPQPPRFPLSYCSGPLLQHGQPFSLPTFTLPAPVTNMRQSYPSVSCLSEWQSLPIQQNPIYTLYPYKSPLS